MVSLMSMCLCLKVRMPPAEKEASLYLSCAMSFATNAHYYKLPGQMKKAHEKFQWKQSNAQSAPSGKRHKNNKGVKRAQHPP